MYQNQSESIDKIIPALIKAQSEIIGAVKDGKNPHFKNSYSTLESVINACKGPLNSNDLMFVQSINVDGDNSILETKVYHSSGQWIASHTKLVVSKNDAQGHGSSISYFRRYSLAALLGIAQIDDDGNEAVADRISLEQIKELEYYIKTYPPLSMKISGYMNSNKISGFKNLSQEHYNTLKRGIESFIQQNTKEEVTNDAL